MSAGQGPDRNGDAERLAAAIDQGRPPGSVADAELARDLDIVAMLRTRGAAFDPHPADRAQAKQRLMAALMAANSDGAFASSVAAPVAAELTAPIAPVASEDATTVMGVISDDEAAPTVVAEETGAAEEGEDAESSVAAPTRAGRAGRHSLPTRPAGRSRASKRPAARGLRRRVAVVGASALAALVALATLGAFAGRDALPGDALYAMKRISENTALAFTFDDAARAQRHLELATTRLDEVEQLTGRDSTDAELVESAMRDFDSSTGEGSRMLLAAQDASGPAALADLRTWASEQAARLEVLRSSLPAPAVAEADTSIALLDRLLGRTEALEARSECSEVTSNVTDDLGPLPSEGTCSPRPAVVDDPDTAADESSATTAPGEGGSESTDPTGGTETDTPQESDTPGSLLPELGPGGIPLSGAEGPTTDGSTTDEGGQVSVPLPLVPPIQLPPLLPGLPGVTIG